jgi:hypothetical protein
MKRLVRCTMCQNYPRRPQQQQQQQQHTYDISMRSYPQIAEIFPPGCDFLVACIHLVRNRCRIVGKSMHAVCSAGILLHQSAAQDATQPKAHCITACHKRISNINEHLDLLRER